MRDGDRLSEDTEGTELPDLETARAEAIAAAREILSDHIAEGVFVSGRQIEIHDEAGQHLDTVTFESTFKAG